MSVIEVNKLTKDYGHGRGIFDVTFEVHKGETLGFLGPNGAGKSTTMRHLMGFSKPHSGMAKIDGLDSTSKHHEILKNVGYLPGEVALPDGLTGREFISMMKNMRRTKGDGRTNELLKLFEMDPDGDVKRMSIGEKRKLAVVTAFMSDPDILLLDEPTSGLDPVMQEVFINFICEEKKRGKTILLSSHIFSEVEALCDRIAIIKDGRLISTVDAADVKHGLKNEFTIEFETTDDYDRFINSGSSPEKGDKSAKKCVISVPDEKTNDFLSALSKCSIRSLDEHSVSLEEYFMHFYKNDKKFGVGGIQNA
ncbi:ABC transporter ATP-binding protein [Ruminococcus sp.]|uniref:ABC transporter ATP-binding protein n=1 Tax=Ruminococcus sp. TaxID=41978 RepID=UPI0026007A3B|nr:ABC transporter ATP-binding protein [Ruminococcus sp.]MBQ8966384.1 ABC transporter ATP-binding protein [Ruminococcus sp.]